MSDALVSPSLVKGRYLEADWPASATVKAVVSTRLGSLSEGRYAGFNPADHVSDADADANVYACRQQLAADWQWSAPPQWLQQVHGTHVVEAEPELGVPVADGVWTARPGQPCIVMTADCLPVFLCNKSGSRVGVVHAGWRGLAAGILEEALLTFADTPDELMAWLGPAIGPTAFEVGDDVRNSFISTLAYTREAFIPGGQPGKWLADIYLLARLRLYHAGVKAVYGGNFCTFTQTEFFYSYRRDGQTGRMANIIWIDA